MSKLRKFLAGNVVGLVALFFALGGTAVAARGLITGSDIAAATITGYNVAPDTLTGANINEQTLGKVASAANADQLGGVPAAKYLSGYQVVSNKGDIILPGLDGEAHAACPTGTRVLGGGFGFSGAAGAQLPVSTSLPDASQTGWSVSAVNESSDPVGLYAFAICANVTP